MRVRFTSMFKGGEARAVESEVAIWARKCLICRYLKVSVAGRLCFSQSVGKCVMAADLKKWCTWNSPELDQGKKELGKSRLVKGGIAEEREKEVVVR